MTNPDPRARLLTLFDRLSSWSHDRCGDRAIALLASATFGGLELDTNACTMCLACTNLCPTGALRADRDGAELGFIEAVCVQCGLCEHGCPEDAIKRQPRFDYQALRGSDMITLNRAKMDNCTQCGRPFMSTALLSSALKHLTSDGAAIRQAKQMLQVWPQCRADNALQAQFPSMPRGPK